MTFFYCGASTLSQLKYSGAIKTRAKRPGNRVRVVTCHAGDGQVYLDAAKGDREKYSIGSDSTGQFLDVVEYPSDMDENQETQAGHEAFLRLFTRFEGNLRAFVASLLPTWEGVDEVMQESSIVLWRKFAQFDQSAESGFLDWSFMIARYEVLKYRRLRATDRLRFSEDVLELLAATAVSVSATQDQRPRMLRECVANLEPANLELVKAVYEDGVAIKDVAEQIGRSPTGLYKALARIRNRLATCVQTKLCAAVAEGLT